MSAPASFVYSPSQVREMDRIAIEELGIPAYELMERAGRFAFESACARYRQARRWLILCGAGNNAGDGYVVARLAALAGMKITVAALCDPQRLQGAAAQAWRDYAALGGTVVQFTRDLCVEADLVIDALLGTGLARSLEGAYLHAVESVNAAGGPVLALDIPTGLNAATGHVMGKAIRADATATFIARKQGLYLGAGPDYAGTVLFSDLGVPLARIAHVTPQLRLFDAADRARLLPRRPRSAHKGDFGHVLVIGGDHGMGGAIRLAGEAALRTGAGLVTVATRPENVTIVSGSRPELMCFGVERPPDLARPAARASIRAIGPGLGREAWGRALFEAVLGDPRPLVIDADGLNILAEMQPRRCDTWILTPHPGEAARLLGCSSREIQADRLHSVEEIAARFGGIALLKGRCTLVAAAGELPYVIDAGNPGMASGGMGDVLTGIVAGLLAQGPPDLALQLAACAADVHARSADEAAAAGGERGLIASDVLAGLRPWLNPPS